jgi:hypothetical protein
VWRDRFKAGAVATTEIDSERFEQVFASYPLLRRVYGARDWQPESSRVRPQIE